MMRYQSFLQETVSKDCRIKQQTGYDTVPSALRAPKKPNKTVAWCQERDLR